MPVLTSCCEVDRFPFVHVQMSAVGQREVLTLGEGGRVCAELAHLIGMGRSIVVSRQTTCTAISEGMIMDGGTMCTKQTG